jgi:hypothetical protein
LKLLPLEMLVVFLIIVIKGDRDYAHPLFSFSMSNVGLLPHVSYILLD